MTRKALAWVFVLALGVTIYRPVLSVAQSGGLEAREKDIARTKEILHKLREGQRLTRQELDVLDRVLSEVDRARRLEPSLPPLPSGFSTQRTKNGSFYMYVVDLDKSSLRSYWLDQGLQPYETVARLAEEQKREGYRLQFAINGGIYDEQRQPKGLYIEQGKLLRELDTAQPGPNQGNFYLEPNGVFAIDSKGDARILTTQSFTQQFPPKTRAKLQLAVQSGPALLINGVINSQFAENSNNRKLRSGVGLITDRRIAFAMSSEPTSFYDFAAVFAKVGCRDALYLDGDVGAIYVEDRVSIRLGPPLVTILAVSEKLRSQ